MSEPDTFMITRFDPFKFRGQRFGEAVTFNNAKQHVRFSSKFHAPDYLTYKQIASIDVQFDPKRWLLWVGMLTFVIIVGLFFILAKFNLPPWKITFNLKKDPPLVIRARLTVDQVPALISYPTVPIQQVEKKK